MLYDIKRLAITALNGYAGGTIKRSFNLDVNEYSWVNILDPKNGTTC